ncbi:MAG: hypothetical protein ACJAY2_003303 [Pseudomonadales bacterium]|jgi:hypothetical protein
MKASSVVIFNLAYSCWAIVIGIRAKQIGVLVHFFGIYEETLKQFGGYGSTDLDGTTGSAISHD